MYREFSLFERNMEQVRELASIYQYLEDTIAAPISFDDILRSQVVYSVSAFDKLIHDLVRTGMVDIFMGRRTTTPKYLSEAISLKLYGEINSASVPPKEVIFEQAIFKKLQVVSYQDPSKVAEGLSFIWEERQKWQKIAASMGTTDSLVKTKLKLIVSRRNSIAHEADIDPSSGTKYGISKLDSEDITDFLYQCGAAIFQLVV
ncbi:MAG: hypothetical protein F6K30_28235 [Cyanothece sp. SIO2G6]|nr:hypothetical protein [Cyanothece sp. SIO2G6]